MCDLTSMFGGPSENQEAIQGQTQSFGQTLQGNYNQEFANQQEALSNLNTEIGRVESGNAGPGWGAAENAAVTTGIVNNAGAAAQQAEQAAQDRAAGQVFGGQSATSGLNRTGAIQEQVNAGIATNVANQKASLLNQATQANYQQGLANAQSAISGYNALAGQYGSAANAAMGGSEKAEATAFGEQTQIDTEKEQEAQGILGAVEQGVGMLAGGIGGALSAGGGIGDTLKGFAGGALGDSGMFLSNPSSGGGGGGGNNNYFG